MNNTVILPILIPLVSGLIMILFRERVILQRVLGLAALFMTAALAVYLIVEIQADGIQVLHLGGWEAPFGISLVADLFSAILVLTASVVAVSCFCYSFFTIGKVRETHYYYPFILFLVTGVNGSFLTGDLFNLFVCFEVMLISSYVLISMGGTSRQLRGSVKYMLVNLISSFLFLVAVAYLYAVTGTLNMAHLSERIAESGQDGLLTAISVLFLVVFGLKSALFLFFWLPDSYGAAPAAVSALFAALLTKVGIYAIFRMFTLVFYHEPQFTHLFIGILGGATMLLGAAGAVAYGDIRRILTYNVIISIGFIAAGLAAFTAEALTGSIYYLIHDMIAKALIFLIGGTVIAITGSSRLKDMSGLIRTHPYLGWMFFIASLAIAGIPPLSGFLGKVFITKGTFETGYYWLGAIGLFTSLMVLYSLMKIFMNAFWGETILRVEMEKVTTKGLSVPIGLLAAVILTLGLGAEGVLETVASAAESLKDPSQYISAVLGK